jgi:pimeloyl-ACP methyl ester carboxylesterase
MQIAEVNSKLEEPKSMHMFRTRFGREIVAEFLPPEREVKRPAVRMMKTPTTRVPNKDRVIVLCDGMPSIPRKQGLAEFLATRGYWVFYPRYRGAWESGGEFLERSPHLDILDVIEALGGEIHELAFGKKFRVRASEVFVIGGSFGGAAAILCSLDERVKKVVANCPVVDWGILREEEKTETSNPNYAAYIGAAFGKAYRLSDRNWRKLYGGKFYNPMRHVGEIEAAKIMMFHAKDDPHVPYESVVKFARESGAKLKLLKRGGHLSTDMVVRKYWREIGKFFLA